MNARGSAATEACVAAVSVITLCCGGMSALYAVFARVWLERSLYEITVCLAGEAGERACEKSLRSSVAFALPIGELRALKTHRSSRSTSAEIRFRIGDETLVLSDRRRLPLGAKGFGTIALLCLLPVLVASMATVSSAFLLLRTDAEARHHCRVRLLEEQSKVAQTLEELLALNPRARALRALARGAQAQAMALPPPFNAPAVAALESLRAQQLALAAKQRFLLAKGKLISAATPVKVAFDLKRKVAARSEQRLDYRRSFEVAKFDLVANPPGDLTPDYEPAPTFGKSQRMRVGWDFAADAVLPDWAKPIVRSHGLRSRGTCAATLEKGGTKWKPILSADKS